MMILTAVFVCLAVLSLSSTPVRASGPVISCCLKTTNTKVRVSQLDQYYIQKKGLCPIEAVIFTTGKGVKICSNPTDTWAKRAMATVDSSRRKAVTADKRAMATVDSRRRKAVTVDKRAMATVHSRRRKAVTADITSPQPSTEATAC